MAEMENEEMQGGAAEGSGETQDVAPDAPASPDDTSGFDPSLIEAAMRPKKQRRGLSVFGPMMIPAAVVRVAVGLLALGGMTGGTFFLVTDIIAPRLGGPAAVTEAGEAEPTEVDKPDLPGDQYVVEQIVVNPSGTYGKRFLRFGVALESHAGPEVLAELEQRKSQVRDMFIRSFSERSLEELTDPAVREEIRVACLGEINSFLVAGSVDRLYFTDYVLQ